MVGAGRCAGDPREYLHHPALCAAHAVVFPGEPYFRGGLGTYSYPSRISKGNDALVPAGYVCLAWTASCRAYRRAAGKESLVERKPTNERPQLEDALFEI